MKSKLPAKILEGKRVRPKTVAKYLEILEKIDESKVDKPSLLIKAVMDAYSSDPETNDQKRRIQVGGLFELAICESIIRAGISPIYIQTELEFVPLAKFDILLYHKQKPVALSLKTSLRERWKQAAFEGDKLKQIYRQAESYLITLSEEDAANRNKDIDEKKFGGFDQVIIASAQEWDELVEKLKKMHSKDPFQTAKKIDPIIKGEKLEDSEES